MCVIHTLLFFYMNINQEQTKGCDKTSRIYGNMFNVLQDVMVNEGKLKELSPLDYSALGMYIGKFVEQEINSSVVQIMRAFCGIDMPEYYCKRDPFLDWEDALVKNGKKTVNLNEQLLQWDRYSLKTIMLGDAYYSLEQLKEEDDEGFFNDYPWLSDKIFLEAWRNLFTFRNKMAHIGEIIDADMLKENYEHFLRFLRYMPDILKAKKELAPDEYIDALPTIQKYDKLEDKPYLTANPKSDKPHAPKKVAQRYCELNDSGIWNDEYYDIIGKYNFDAIIFEGNNGKKGLKDCLDNILVPADYDGFDFIPKPFEFPRKSVIAIRNGKYHIVALDGSGKELTKVPYDYIRLIMYYHMGSPYIYRKNGLKAWGLMNTSGEEICDSIIDRFAEGVNSVWFESGEKMGFWQFGVKFLPPIYDNIEMPGELEDPLVFTLNGVQGYVRFDGTFLPLSEFKRLEEEDESSLTWDYICEQYDID